MKLRRSPYEIVWQVLDYCRKPRKVTHIIQGCNLNSKSVKKYLDLLMQKELITIMEENYKTTKRGIEYINLIQDIYEGLFSTS